VRQEQLAVSVKHIPYKSRLHQQIIANFKQRLRASKDEKRKKREDEWEKSENTFTAYLPESELDSSRAAKRDRGQQDFITLSIPYSYSMLLTAHTYYTSVFLGRDPVMQVKGRHGESQTAEATVEALLDYQLMTGGGMPALFIWLMDVGKYGQGILGHYWDKETFVQSQYVEEPRTFLGLPIPGTSERKLVSQEMTGYEGNRLYNVRPQDFFHDPSVPLYRFQDGEYCIVYDRLGWTKIATRAAAGLYYSIDKLGDSYDRDTDGTGYDTNLPGQDIAFYGSSESGKTDHPKAVDIHEFHWNVIPSELGLGSGTRPEKWVFTIGGEETVISAQPLGLLHNSYPFDAIVQEVEGYNVYNRSMLEVLDPLNKTMEWLFNSHFYNVRAALNNMFAVDPSRINTRDMEEPGPGKMIRLKPAGYGQDIRTMMAQFNVQDVTRGNLQDSDIVGQLGQRVTGVNDNIMGQVNPSGRKTATEVRSSTTFGINRLKTSCEWFSASGFAPLTAKLIMSTQQLMSVPRKYKVVGDQALWGESFLQATPDSIAGFYDFVPVDGTMPVDRFAQVNLWQQLLANMARVPGALQQYDISKIFAFIAQLGGIKNINRFRIQVVPDMQMQAQAQAGNVVPMRGNMQEPGQIPGMGATG
jgi:hypothetical protein